MRSTIRRQRRPSMYTFGYFPAAFLFLFGVAAGAWSRTLMLALLVTATFVAAGAAYLARIDRARLRNRNTNPGQMQAWELDYIAEASHRNNTGATAAPERVAASSA